MVRSVFFDIGGRGGRQRGLPGKASREPFRRRDMPWRGGGRQAAALLKKYSFPKTAHAFNAATLDQIGVEPVGKLGRLC